MLAAKASPQKATYSTKPLTAKDAKDAKESHKTRPTVQIKFL
jgi:hypothetical protein